MIPHATSLAAVAVFAVLGATCAARAEPTGTWLTQNADAHIRVAKCGQAMCGTIVWLRDPIDAATGQPQVDTHNPDPAKRTRKILGLRIFAMAPDGNGGFSGGIYNADDGQTYGGKLVQRSADRIEIQGCSGPLCGSETWTKVGR
jgi:uncharacterized protein (DUF2147 family)